MQRTIVGVDYRHPMVTAYVKIVGPAKEDANQQAIQVAEHIRESLPHAQVDTPRFMGISTLHEKPLFEIPVILGSVSTTERSFFAELLLRGVLPCQACSST